MTEIDVHMHGYEFDFGIKGSSWDCLKRFVKKWQEKKILYIVAIESIFFFSF